MFLQKTCGFCLKRDFEKREREFNKENAFLLDEGKLEKKFKNLKKMLNLAEFNLANAQIT